MDGFRFAIAWWHLYIHLWYLMHFDAKTCLDFSLKWLFEHIEFTHFLKMSVINWTSIGGRLASVSQRRGQIGSARIWSEISRPVVIDSLVDVSQKRLVDVAQQHYYFCASNVPTSQDFNNILKLTDQGFWSNRHVSCGKLLKESSGWRCVERKAWVSTWATFLPSADHRRCPADALLWLLRLVLGVFVFKALMVF